MSRITVYFKPSPTLRAGQEKKIFESQVSRSMCSVSFEIGFVVITDTYGSKFSYPADSIDRIEEEAPSQRW